MSTPVENIIKTKESKVNTPAIITLCIAIASFSWAASTEIHNYRLKDIVTDISEVKQAMEVNKAEIRLGIDNRTEIWRAIDKLVTASTNRDRDIADIKRLLEKHMEGN